MLSMLLRLWRHDAILLPVLWDPISSFVQTNGWFFTEPSEPGKDGAIGHRFRQKYKQIMFLWKILLLGYFPSPLESRPSYGRASRYSTVFVGCFNTKRAIRSKSCQIRSVIICNCVLEQLLMWIWTSWARNKILKTFYLNWVNWIWKK